MSKPQAQEPQGLPLNFNNDRAEHYLEVEILNIEMHVCMLHGLACFVMQPDYLSSAIIINHHSSGIKAH
jgi:hypothetical protein